MIKRIRIVNYGSNIFSSFFFFIFSKNNPKNKQMSIGKKKFNMDPKKVKTERHFGIKMKWLCYLLFSQPNFFPLPFSLIFSAGQFWVFDYRDHPSDFVYIYSLCWDLSELWFFDRVPVNSKLWTVNSLPLST